MHRCEAISGKAEPLRHAPAVFLHLFGFVMGTEADIEALIKPFRDAALPGEEAVADTVFT